jgi:hypothetical protein
MSNVASGKAIRQANLNALRANFILTLLSSGQKVAEFIAKKIVLI